LRGPVTTEAPFFVLLESFGGEGEAGRAQFEDALATAFEREFLVDAVLAKSESEIAALWSLRDGLPEASRLIQPTIGFDVSLPIALMEKFDSELHRRIGARWPNCRIWIFGHLGDSNLHVVVRDEDQKAVREEVDELVYELVGELDGSVSAEHGIGLLKRAHLHQSRNESEIGLMKLLKRTLDPNNILSRGRIFEL